MLRALRFIGLLALHCIVAVAGTTIAEHVIWRVVPAHSICAVLWKECFFSALCATVIGVSIWRIWRTSSQVWTWVPAAVWFALGFLLRHGDVWGSSFPVHSGSAFNAPDARSFFAFTVPLIRATFYSLGGYASSKVPSRSVPLPRNPITSVTSLPHSLTRC